MAVMQASGAGVLHLRPARRASIYVLEARAQFLTLSRTPGFTIPTLVFPLMFYVFFGVVMSFSPTAPTYLLATYGVFGLIGPALFGFGVGFANERDSGALLLKQTTPMPVAAYLVARVAAALVFGMVIVTGLFLLGGLRRGRNAVPLAVVCVGRHRAHERHPVLRARPGHRRLGKGTVRRRHRQPRLSADGVPVRPVDADRRVAVIPAGPRLVFPAYHQAQLALNVINMDEGGAVGIHVLTIGIFTAVFLVIAAVGFRRVSQQ